MKTNVINEKSYNEILQRLTSIEAKVKERQRSPEETFFDNQEFIQIMNISKRTAQVWRDEKLVAFSQVGNKIYYCLSDVLQLLHKNKVPASK